LKSHIKGLKEPEAKKVQYEKADVYHRVCYKSNIPVIDIEKS
jgi:hypothetical protein